MQRFTYALAATDLPKGFGYQLYGALNALAGDPLTASWHEARHPRVSQHLYWSDGTFYWRVALWGDLAESDRLSAAEADLADRLAGLDRLTVAGRVFTLEGQAHEALTLESLLHHHLADQDPPDRLNLVLRSPLAFKRRGHFDPLPQPDLMVQSLINRWGAALEADTDRMETYRAMAGDQVWPARLRLRTTAVPIKGSHIPGSLGEVQLILKAGDPLRRFLALLFALGEWSGIGVKTALGMGGLDVAFPGWTSLPASAMIRAPKETTEE